MLAGCFPTYQAARIDPGWHLDAGATWLHDQPRDGVAQGADLLFSATPSYGWDDRLEVGIPLVAYFEGIGGGAEDRYAWLMPYFKVGVLPTDSRSHLSASVQASLIGVSNLGLHFSREIGEWEPQVSIGYLPSGGPAGDDPLVTRFQQDDQSLLTFALGVNGRGPTRPTVQLGVLRNSYRDRSYLGPDGPTGDRRTLWDLFIAVRFRLAGR